MRVAIFTEVYLPAINGVVTHVKTLKEGLEALGHKVLIVTADSNVKKIQTSDDVMYCPAIKLKKIYNFDLASPISVDRVKKIKEFDPDIIHIHNEFGIGFSGLMISKMLKVPLVYTLHTMYDDYVYYVANKHFCRFVTSASHKYAKALANAASAITGPSKKVEEYFRNCGVKKQVNVIPNTVEVDRFRRDAADPQRVAEIQKEFGFDEKDIVACFCGRMGQEKNIALLLDYWAQTVKHDDHLKLLLIGDGPLLEEHKKQAEDLHIDDMVKFAGRIEHMEIIPYYACCRLYITASLTECHSMSMLEGMSMELPVLSIRDELNADQIEEGESGYMFSNAEEMYKHLCEFRDMPKEQLEEFGKHTRQCIATAGAEQLASNILSIYYSVIEQARQKAIAREITKKPRKTLSEKKYKSDKIKTEKKTKARVHKVKKVKKVKSAKSKEIK